MRLALAITLDCLRYLGYTPNPGSDYFRPGGVDTYLRPGGVDLYKRP